nr:unnamed protein product [Spirometra erinaceieuropaei]
MDDEQLSKRSRVLRDKESNSPLQDPIGEFLEAIGNQPKTWEWLAQDLPFWRRTAKTGTAFKIANEIAAVRAKRAARRSQAPSADIINTTPSNTLTLTQVTNIHTTTTAVFPNTTASTPAAPTTTIALTTDAALPPIAAIFVIPATTSMATTISTTAFIPATDKNDPAPQQASPIPRPEMWAQCQPALIVIALTSRIDLICHLRIHSIVTEAPAPRAPTYTRRTASIARIVHAHLYTA